jgi:YidC/Oxa1 family membrane protein insertase
VDLKFNTNGNITEAHLKKISYLRFLPVYLAKGNDHSFDLVLTAKDGRKIHTKILSSSDRILRESVTFKAPVGTGSIEYRFEMKPNNYMLDFNIRTHELPVLFPQMKTQ